MAIVYQGVDAVRKIREVLGPTDPRKAPPGSIRKEFGETIMINAAHASDSKENAAREMKIIRIAENDFPALIEERLSRLGSPSRGFHRNHAFRSLNILLLPDSWKFPNAPPVFRPL